MIKVGKLVTRSTREGEERDARSRRGELGIVRWYDHELVEERRCSF
jgi:hypothetical protein